MQKNNYSDFIIPLAALPGLLDHKYGGEKGFCVIFGGWTFKKDLSRRSIYILI